MPPAGPDPTHERVVGRVGRPHGLHGEVAVDVRTDFPEQRFAPGTVLGLALGPEPASGVGGDRTLVVRSSRPHAGRLLVAFEGVTDRNTAEQLRGVLLTVAADSLPSLGDRDEFHDHQLEGLTAVRVDGGQLGTVREVVHAPAQDLLVLDTEHGEGLVPFVRAIVVEVDLAAGRIVVDPPEGLLGRA